jgi:filamentous hemagglutinin family protein
MKLSSIFALAGILLFSAWLPPSVNAQTVGAQNLSSDTNTGTSVMPDSVGQQFSVTGGTIRESSLFHSFENFSPESWSVVFDLSNAAYDDIDFVIGRVTGSESSLINGALKLVGGHQPDLLLINPAGIEFGPNASLQLPGSFLAGTAESVLFDDYGFSAIAPTPVPLLSVNTPLGLQMSSQSGAIRYQGSGHSLAAVSDPIFSPYIPTQAPSGLIVAPGETLALIGNTLDLDGATLTAPGGRLNLLSLSSGSANLNVESQGFSLAAQPGNTAFSNILLDHRALLDVSKFMGGNTGEIALQGENITLNNGSVIFAQNRGVAPAGNLTIDAKSSLSLGGQLTGGNVLSRVISETLGPGRSGNIVITTPNLSLLEGGAVVSRTFAQGDSGAITVAAERLFIDGHVAIAPDLFSHLGSFTSGAGRAGNVSVSTDSLRVTQGGYAGSSTLFADGQSGDVHIDARDIVVNGMVSGSLPSGIRSLIGAVALGGKGSAGNLQIVTERLSLGDSGSIYTTSFTDGSAGSVDITATDWIHLTSPRAGFQGSTISSGVTPVTQASQQQFVSTALPTGDAGQVNIHTRRLQIDEGSNVSVANFGTGRAGMLNTHAQEIVLNGGDILATTTSGQGGDIVLGADTLRMSQGSLIQATSLGAGNGGNITIDSRFIIGRGNSDIIANAVDGKGGNIHITTQGIYGLQFRDALTSESDITASSELGVDGTVEIANTGLEVNSALIELPAYFSDVDDQVAASCAQSSGNQFVASGRGGLAIDPRDRLSSTHLWQDTRSLSVSSEIASETPSETASEAASETTLEDNKMLAEATRWQHNSQGQVELIAAASSELALAQTACLQ